MTQDSIYYHVLRQQHLRNKVLVWWARLHRNEQTLNSLDWNGNKQPLPRGIAAELRRCHTVDDALLTEGFRHLWLSLTEDEAGPSWTMMAWATVAAVLAEVRTQSSTPFARALGSEKDRTGKPYLSELRFTQLQKSHDADIFLKRARRAVALLGNQAHILSLADSILHWHQEKHGRISQQPEKRLTVRWAMDYFTALSEYQK